MRNVSLGSVTIILNHTVCPLFPRINSFSAHNVNLRHCIFGAIVNLNFHELVYKPALWFYFDFYHHWRVYDAYKTKIKSDYINKKLFHSTLCNDMKIRQNVGTLGYKFKFKVGTERVK